MSDSLKKKYIKLKHIKNKYRHIYKKVKVDIKKKHKTSRNCKFPKDITTKHTVLIKKIKKLNKLKIEHSKIENTYPYITLVNKHIDHICCALTSKYERCQQKVKYIHANINNKGEKKKFKFKVPFCARHMKNLLNSEDKKTLPYGFYFESDLYKKICASD